MLHTQYQLRRLQSFQALDLDAVSMNMPLPQSTWKNRCPGRHIHKTYHHQDVLDHLEVPQNHEMYMLVPDTCFQALSFLYSSVLLL